MRGLVPSQYLPSLPTQTLWLPLCQGHCCPSLASGFRQLETGGGTRAAQAACPLDLPGLLLILFLSARRPELGHPALLGAGARGLVLHADLHLLTSGFCGACQLALSLQDSTRPCLQAEATRSSHRGGRRAHGYHLPGPVPSPFSFYKVFF